MLSIVIMEIENPGNLGAIARVMANFNQKNLILINPKCSPKDSEARCRAKHAQEILQNAKIADKEILKSFDVLIAATARLGTDYNLHRSPITPEQLAATLKPTKRNIGILIGREGDGLYNEEIMQCDFIVSIPTSKKYPAMNISHSLSIILYELFKKSKSQKITDGFNPASKKDKEIALMYINQVIEQTKFERKGMIVTQYKLWKRLLGKSFLTKREAYAVMGFFKKLRK